MNCKAAAAAANMDTGAREIEFLRVPRTSQRCIISCSAQGYSAAIRWAGMQGELPIIGRGATQATQLASAHTTLALTCPAGADWRARAPYILLCRSNGFIVGNHTPETL